MRGARWILGAVIPLLISIGTVALANQPPEGNAGPDQEIRVDEATILFGSAADDDGDPIVDWLWAIVAQPPDSDPYMSEMNAPDPTFSGDQPGDYVLSLVASDGVAWSLPDFVKVHVFELLPPIAVGTADLTCGTAPLTVHFDGSASLFPNSSPHPEGGHYWSFGDSSNPSGEISPTHVYEYPGEYTSKLTVFNDFGLSDFAEVEIYACASSAPDLDTDGACDACDNCAGDPNTDQPDTDGDGIGDACDPEECDGLDNNGDGFVDEGFVDTDVDGAADCVDNCVSVENSDQADADGDSVGDACDTCTDTDGDGWGNPGFPVNTCPSDNCPDDWNDDQANGDGDPAGNACDCAPSDPNTYPGAFETNDGLDNQCLGDAGYMMVDEITAVGFHNPSDKTELSWAAQPGATWYQAARSEEPEFLSGCLMLATSETLLSDDEDLPSGTVYYYLVRALLPHAGSWGMDSSQVGQRWPACTAIAEVFSFVDTAGDDVAATALYDWFDGHTVGTSDYILFELKNETEVHAWCSERADFYRDTYLARALTGGSESSGTWAKWYRGPATGGSWSEPDNGAYTNHYSFACYDAYSWCSETTLGGLYLMANPNDTGQLEAVDFLTSFCITGGCQLTIIIGDTRWDACGF